MDVVLSANAVKLIKETANPEALYRRMYDDAITQLAIFPEAEDNARVVVAIVFRVSLQQVISDERARMKGIAEGSL